MKKLLLALAVPFLAITACGTKKIDKHIFWMNLDNTAFKRSFEWWDDGDYLYKFNYDYEGVDSETGDRRFGMYIRIDNTTANNVIFKASKVYYENAHYGRFYPVKLYNGLSDAETYEFDTLPGDYILLYSPLLTDDENFSLDLIFHIIINNDEFTMHNVRTGEPL